MAPSTLRNVARTLAAGPAAVAAPGTVATRRLPKSRRAFQSGKWRPVSVLDEYGVTAVALTGGERERGEGQRS